MQEKKFNVWKLIALAVIVVWLYGQFEKATAGPTFQVMDAPLPVATPEMMPPSTAQPTKTAPAPTPEPTATTPPTAIRLESVEAGDPADMWVNEKVDQVGGAFYEWLDDLLPGKNAGTEKYPKE